MEPTIPIGSTVVVDDKAYEDAQVQRNDIICFRPELNPEWKWIFRVAGLPGEHLSLRDGTIYVDGAATDITGVSGDSTGVPITLNGDQYFVIGDNSADAMDSRFIGPVARSQIIGKVVHIQSSGG